MIMRAAVPFPKAALSSECNVDPATRVQNLALVVPEADNRNELGLALQLRLEASELERCARAIGAASGGTKPRTEGAFTVFATGDLRADTLAVAENGLAILAPNAWALSMTEAANGRAPSAERAPPHGDLLAAVKKGDGGAPRTVIASVALPRATRERLRRELESELPSDSVERKSMEGVLGVEAAAAALDVATDTDLRIELRCESTASCDAVRALVERKRKSWLDNPVLRLLGVAPALESLTFSSSSGRLSAHARLSTIALQSAIEKALLFRASAARERPKADAGP